MSSDQIAPPKTPDEAIVQIADLLEQYRVALRDKAASDLKSKTYISVDPLALSVLLADIRAQIENLIKLL